jgi:hypothetical protein
MTSELRLLKGSDDPAYERLVQDARQGMFVHSLAFGRFLATLLPEATGFRLGVFSNGQLKAVIPAFAREGRFGTVVNSLPFFGSHGGMITTDDCDETMKLKLLSGFRDYCNALGAVSATIIESPFEKSAALYETLSPSLTDDRIGQITRLPDRSAGDIREALLAKLHLNARRNIKKTEGADFIVTIDGSLDSFRQIHAIHESNMAAIDGTAKPWMVFEAILENFFSEQDYRIYIARHKNGDVAAGLLVFYYKKTVEYFTPVVNAAYRSTQPLSLLIFTAMVDAVVEREARWWNWGGTWRSQEGVYTFKAKWGAEDCLYRYHVLAGEGFEKLVARPKSEILAEYPYFYTFPFNRSVEVQ